MAHLPGKFVWFEHLSPDVPAATRFYERLFGWRSSEIRLEDERYFLIKHGDREIGGFRAAPADEEAPHWLSYLSVEDVDTAMARAVAAGALVLAPATDFPPLGRGATVRDPTGAVFSIWRGLQDDPPDSECPPPNDWCWNELLTADPDAALAFYTSAFGYSVESMPMGDAGTYHLLLAKGLRRAGVMASPQAGMPANWLPYVAVDDADASAAQAATLGGKVLVPPRDIPGVGRFSVLSDPVGAVVAVFRPRPME
jgi:uncharacterized protein